MSDFIDRNGCIQHSSDVVVIKDNVINITKPIYLRGMYDALFIESFEKIIKLDGTIEITIKASSKNNDK